MNFLLQTVHGPNSRIGYNYETHTHTIHDTRRKRSGEEIGIGTKIVRQIGITRRGIMTMIGNGKICQFEQRLFVPSTL